MLDYETHRAMLDAERAVMHAQWAAEDVADERARQRLKAATIVGAVLLALMCVAVVMFREVAPIVAGVALAFAVVVWFVVMAWAIKEMR